MRSVNLKINPFERFSSFKIDNESISPYSQLANYARQDSLLWLKNMFPSIDQQVYDLYNLTVTASSFELFLIARLYNAKAQANPLCKRIISENYDLGLTIEERYNWISSKEALIFGSDKEKYKIPIYENGYIQYDRNFFYKPTPTCTARRS